MRFWGIALVMMLAACTTTPTPRYDGAEPTTPAVEPPVQGALYGRVMHASGTGAPRAAVGVRQWEDGQLLGLLVTAGLSCAVGACAEPKYVKQTPEGTYSFPPEMVREKQISVVAEWGDRGVSAEVFFKNENDPQRVPDLVLWEPDLKMHRYGDTLVTWPRHSPGAVYTIYSQNGGQVSPPTTGTARLVPDWRVEGDLWVEARTVDGDVKYLHRSARKPVAAKRGFVVGRTQLAGRDCVGTQGRKRVVLKFGDSIETTDDGVTFKKITVPQPKWGVRTTTVDAKYVCGREVGVW
ncbi:hypothetical protein LFM09_04565 [Lentzea alba]|uniref:hypothetical protein n=1 Tax=Lentzea alba TaxID=2714351 RepID=UPI0039BF13F5